MVTTISNMFCGKSFLFYWPHDKLNCPLKYEAKNALQAQYGGGGSYENVVNRLWICSQGGLLNSLKYYCLSTISHLPSTYINDTEIHRPFAEYESGFGGEEKDRWLGLRYQHLLTRDRRCMFLAVLNVDQQSSYSRHRHGCGGYPNDCNSQVT